ncbi:aspartyl protease family protein At5g10770-like [Bidens hawaiensis]|uniref:aspartyl protease family protein At5g10770-like n=1 Tax=Bidens hawaiensis TaxID=980011 RepID=UPI00404A00C4
MEYVKVQKRSIIEKVEMSSPNSLVLLLCSLSLYLVLVAARKEFVVDTSEDNYHTLRLTSLFPSSTCNPSNKDGKKRGSLEVVHKHGPCSKFSKDIVKPLTIEEIITQDQLRVSSLRARLTTNTSKQDMLDSKTTLPAKSGSTIGSGNYIVTVGFGTPKKDLTLIFDTGSDLTWIQCQPCAGECYNQQEPIFDPSMSTTYTNISCTSTECSALLSATGFEPRCFTSTCVYTIKYGDGSFTAGFFGKEKLTISSKDVVNNFYFGCGQDNEGLFRGFAGLLGLGQDKLSIVSQAANKYGNVFSYCLPSSSSTGYLTFGNNGTSSKVKYTPFTTLGGSLYGLELVDLYVGGTKLTISPTVFKTSGMIIDSGTVITRLPPTAYSALREAFMAQMTDYPTTTGTDLFDTCYDLSNFQSIKVPTIGVLWGADTHVDVPLSGIFIVYDKSQVCLAFAGNDNDNAIGIWGNTQQKTMDVVYDLGAKKIGFASGGCA